VSLPERNLQPCGVLLKGDAGGTRWRCSGSGGSCTAHSRAGRRWLERCRETRRSAVVRMAGSSGTCVEEGRVGPRRRRKKRGSEVLTGDGDSGSRSNGAGGSTMVKKRQRLRLRFGEEAGRWQRPGSGNGSDGNLAGCGSSAGDGCSGACLDRWRRGAHGSVGRGARSGRRCRCDAGRSGRPGP
jgi:hypothetical protein